MQVSHCAQSLVVSVLAVGLAVGPAWSVRAASGVEPALPVDGDEQASEPGSGPSQAESTPSEVSAPEPSEGAESVEGAESSEGAEPSEGAESVEGAEPSEGPEPSEGETPEAGGEGPESSEEATPDAGTSEGASAEATVSVRPGAVSTAASSKPIPAGTPPREVETDPRRLRSDENILLRASALSFGVAGLAAVPLVIGLQQAAKARRDIDELDSMATAADRAELEDREQQMNRLALVGGIVAGVQLVTGAVLLGVGLRRRPPKRNHAFAPSAGPGGVGLVWRGRF